MEPVWSVGRHFPAKCRVGSKPRAVHMGYLVDRVGMEQGCPRTSLYICQYHSNPYFSFHRQYHSTNSLYTIVHIYHQKYVTLTTDSVIKWHQDRAKTLNETYCPPAPASSIRSMNSYMRTRTTVGTFSTTRLQAAYRSPYYRIMT